MLTEALSTTDVAQLHFGVSPLAEVAHSLARLGSARIDPPFRGWLDTVRGRLDGTPLAGLIALLAHNPGLAAALCAAPVSLGITIQAQLAALRDQAPAALGALPAVLRSGMAPALADLLDEYWEIALEPHWRTMRAVLQEDVAFRAGELTRHGTAVMVGGLHPAVALTGGVLQVATARPRPSPPAPGTGLVLVPSVFTGPDPCLETGYDGQRHLRYPARGVARLWSPRPATPDGGSLAALLGRRRAAILSCLDVPRSTSELAVRLGQTAPSVSQHLSVLRRSGLVTSWRSGRWVLYRRTALAADLVGANDPEAVGEA
jgi:DNA-binding transcriptional ArsR family regulator